MVKDIVAANENVNVNDREMAVLREHFPACFATDGSFDIARFKEYLSDKVKVTNEGYELRFLGKNYARLLASVDTTTVIVPDEEHNKRPENANSENIYISGDNLDGLKHLLKSYARKVKCIYIDKRIAYLIQSHEQVQSPKTVDMRALGDFAFSAKAAQNENALLFANFESRFWRRGCIGILLSFDSSRLSFAGCANWGAIYLRESTVGFDAQRILFHVAWQLKDMDA